MTRATAAAQIDTEDVGVDLQAAVLRPTRGQHAFESCVEQLGTAIRLGVFPRGSLLPPERDLAGRIGVSRATLREAIAGLRAAGLVETTRGRGGGTIVTSRPDGPVLTAQLTDSPHARDRRDLWLDILDFRRIVEPGAAQLAAGRVLGEPQRQQLAEAHAAVAAAARRSDAQGPKGSEALWSEHRQADSRFHLTVAMLTGSPRTIEAVTAVQAGLHEMLSAIPVLGRNIDHSDHQHARITAAVLDGDPVRARRVMEEHCDDTAALLRGLLA